MSHRGRFPIQPPVCPPSLQTPLPHSPRICSAGPPPLGPACGEGLTAGSSTWGRATQGAPGLPGGGSEDPGGSAVWGQKPPWGFPKVSAVKVHLPTQRTQVRPLTPEDPTCHGATKPGRQHGGLCA